MESLNDAPQAPAFRGGFQAFPDSLNLLSHLDYIPAERNQDNCGDCWVWAGTAIMGIALDVQDSIHDRLSIQYLNSNYDGGSGPGAGSDWACCGGLLEDFAPWYTNKGKAIPWSNTNAHWQDGGTRCSDGNTSVPAASITETPNYPINYATYQYIDTHGELEATAIDNIKTVLNQNRAVQFGIYLPTDVDWNYFFNFWQNNGNDDICDFDTSCSKTWINGEGGGHAMAIVGYNDEAGTANDYWIVLNSWGNDGGDRPQGTYRLKMHMNYDCQYYYPYAPYTGWYNSFWFETLDIDFNITPPSVATAAASGVTDDAATLNGNLTGLGNYGSANVSFEWGETPGGPYPNETTPEVKNSTGAFNAGISGLDPDTPYYYRARAVSNPTVYGSELSFTTSNPLVSIDVTPTNPNIALGRSQQFTATGTYADASTDNITLSVAWTSDNNTVATVGANTGLAQSQAIGQAVIIATSGAISGNTTLTVGPKVLDSISVTPPAPSLDAGRTQQFTATGTYSDASTANLTLTAAWVSSNGTVATIDAAGLATSHATGTTNITATSGVISGNTTLTVGPKVLDSITVTPSGPAIDLGRTQQFEATGNYSDASTANLTASVAWASDNTTVVTIDAAGLATSHAAGNANISATSGAVSGNTMITVGPKVLDSITVTPVNPSIALGNNRQFTATGNYSDASTANITLTVNWTSANTTVATVGANTGLAQGQAAGQAVIIATSGAISGNTTLTVEPPRTLTMIAGANGDVSPAAGPHAYDWGTVVSINATADAGWKFDIWTGDVATVADVNDATTFITMTDDFTVTANFDQPVLTMAVSGNGSVVPAAGPHTYAAGANVTIIATPDAGWEFDSWTGDVTTVLDVNAATTNVTMNDSYTITANFSQAVLTMAVSGSGAVTPAVGAHTYAVGTVVDITAVPDAGWQFDGWTGDVATMNSTSVSSTNITMNGDYTVTASFSVIATGGGGGGGAGARGVTDITSAINPEGRMGRDITAVSSDLQAYIKLTTGTYCLNSAGTAIFWIYIRALDEEETVPAPPEGSVVITPYYEIEPEGTTFNPAVAFTLEYDVWGLPEGVDPYSLAVMYWDVVNEVWVALETIVDAENETVTAYLEHFSLFTVMQWRTPADISVAEIAVDSHEIYEGGQASVEVLLTNSGESAGSYEAMLMVNDVVYETREIAVDGGQSIPAVFELNGLAVGDYTIGLGGSEINFRVLKIPEPAAIEVSELSISRSEADIGDTVEIVVIAANTGELEGSCEIALNINGEIVQTREVQLGGGSCEEVVFTVTVDAAGEHVIEVGGLLGNLVVIEKSPEPVQTQPAVNKPTSTPEPGPVKVTEQAPDEEDDDASNIVWLIVVICIGVAAVAGYYIWRRKSNTPPTITHPDLK